MEVLIQNNYADKILIDLTETAIQITYLKSDKFCGDSTLEIEPYEDLKTFVLEKLNLVEQV